MKTLRNTTRLICCCCGTSTRGRQWWNRDTGYGICDECAESQSKTTGPDTMRSYYGERGTHYLLPSDKASGLVP